ncbi:cytochrome c [Hydrogenophaga sp.]|uniref:c-type cytochrome n=1 Tax=Hydrogenophaga sp. TaxID=1904254 RepID=UPI0035B34AB5
MNTFTQQRFRRWSGGIIAVASTAALIGCGGGNDSTPTLARSSSTAPDTSLAASQQKSSTSVTPTTEGRLLASNCFQCHGTNGTGGFDSIRGGDAKEVLEFLTKPASKEIMAAHAQGYTTAQLQKIIAYLQQ